MASTCRFIDMTTPQHFSKVEEEVSVNKSEYKNSAELAEKITEELSKKGIKGLTMMTSGFRSEFDGLPVIERRTGNYLQNASTMYWGCSNPEIREYAVIREMNGKYTLENYRGIAGRGWTDVYYEELKNKFLELTNA